MICCRSEILTQARLGPRVLGKGNDTWFCVEIEYWSWRTHIEGDLTPSWFGGSIDLLGLSRIFCERSKPPDHWASNLCRFRNGWIHRRRLARWFSQFLAPWPN